MDQATVNQRQTEQAHVYRKQTLAVGTAPVNWNNDDLPDWQPHVPLAKMLDAMAAAGYQGTEFGAGFPRNPIELSALLNSRNLELCGSYHWFHFQDPAAFSAELDGLDEVFSALAAVGCRDLIVASAMTLKRTEIAGRVPENRTAGWSTGEWDNLRRSLNSIRDRAEQWHIQVHFHNHVGSHVESPAEVETLIDYLPDGVDLCFDTGHYAFGGGDPEGFVRRHSQRIGYIHLKDVDPVALNSTRKSGLGFLGALRSYVFCDLGRGSAEIPKIVSTLEAAGYSGWVIVEQDTCPGDPTETATRNRAYLREVCGI
jgi:inosose dehydratase